MPIGGSATELNITGAKLKVSGGVQVSGSIVYTSDATGFGGVTAQIDNDNTLNVTSGKLTGVTKIDRATAATITAITHTNVINNTTIHIALKNTSTTRGVFITLGTFTSDDTVKVNYTDDYMISPGETGMLTLRKVNGVLSLFAREMFSDKAAVFTDDNTNGNRPFYIKDGVNYKYPLYKYTAAGLTSEVIQGTTYYKPTAGITTKSRPPKGIPENVTPPSASSFAIGNNAGMTTINYDVLGVSSIFDFGNITDNGGTSHARFLFTDGEASGSFTESGASSGDSYKLFIDKTNTNLTDTVVATGKQIPKVKGIILDPANESNVLISTQGTGISTVTYSVNSGSEVSTPVSQLSVAHGLNVNVTGTILAYALNASSARLGVKLSKSIATNYSYETFTITKYTNASTTLSITGNGTDNITSVRKNSGSNGWDTGFYTPTFTAPITFEFNKTSGNTDNSVSYIQIGITDTPTVVPAANDFVANMSYYFNSYEYQYYHIASGKGLSVSDGTAWDITKKHYIVYKTNGNVEFWNGDNAKKTFVWGTGKSIRFETRHHINSSTLTNTMTNLRMKRREWDGTKYIN